MKDKEAFFGKYKSKLGSMLQGLKDNLSNSSETGIVSELSHQEGRYDEFDLLTEDGFKKTFWVKDKFMSREVLMISLSPEASPEAIQSFLARARILAQIQHPNILPIYDIALTEEGEAFYTSKLQDGESLANIIKKLRLGDEEYLEKYSLPKLLTIYRKVCEAVAYSHSKGLVHLAIKAENIYLNGFGEVLLCNWEWAKILDELCEEEELQRYSLDISELKDLSLTGKIERHNDFVAPEQRGNRKGQKDLRTDTYALGSLLYNLLTYEHALDAMDDVVPLRERKSAVDIPEALENMTMKALEREPEKRYQEAISLLADLSDYEEGLRTDEEEPEDFWKSFVDLLKRHKAVAVWGSSCLFIIAFGFLAILFHLNQKIEKQATALSDLESKATDRQKALTEIAKELLVESRKHWESRDYTQALAFANYAFYLDFESEEAQVMLAKISLVERDFREAMKYFKRLDMSDLADLSFALSSKSLSHEQAQELLKQIKDPELYDHCKVNYAKKLD